MPMRHASIRVAASIFVATVALAGCGSDSFEAEMRNGLIEFDGYTEAEANEVPLDWLELVAADICDKLERNSPFMQYRDYAIETAKKHRC